MFSERERRNGFRGGETIVEVPLPASVSRPTGGKELGLYEIQQDL